MNNKKTIAAILIVLIATISVLAAKSAPGLLKAPGQADNFYRGITTVGSTSITEVSVESIVLSSTIETRTIGSGQSNKNSNGNLQDRTVSVVNTTVTETTTTTYEAHRGAPVSNGLDLSYTTVTTNIVSDTVETVYGDWGAAYSVPSGTK